MSHSDDPFIEKPDSRKVDDELNCYRDHNRVCNASCVAYLVTAPEGDDFRSQPFAQCVELVSNYRTGKHLVILANLKKKSLEAP